MANDRKRKEATRNRMREKRAASKDSQSETPLNDSHQEQQASCSTGKRRRLDSSADSSTSVRSNASTSSERVGKHRANMTEEQRLLFEQKMRKESVNQEQTKLQIKTRQIKQKKPKELILQEPT
jgi:hypothetical protein